MAAAGIPCRTDNRSRPANSRRELLWLGGVLSLPGRPLSSRS